MKNVLRFKLLIFSVLLLLAPAFGWGQATDFSGIWYIASNGNSTSPTNYAYNPATPGSNYYLRPAADPQQPNNIDAYWYPVGNEAGNDPEKPFLTTNKTGHADLALWVVIKTGDYYLIKHAATGKYVKCEPCLGGGTLGEGGSTNYTRRKTMHLEECTTTPTADAFKFKIDYFNSGEEICIVPKIVEGKTFKYWNIADRNQPFNNGQSSSLYYGGLIGLYSLNNTSLDINSKWRFEHAINPVITYDYITNKVSIDNPLTSSYNDIHFYFTTDGNTPTSSSTEYTTPFEPTGACTVKAIAVRGPQNSDVISLALSQAGTPTVSIDAATYEVTISGDGDAYYYTTDGTDPMVGTNAYTGPFALDYADAGNTIKAIAVKTNMVPSAVGSAVATFQCKAPVISFNNTTQKVVITCADNEAAIFYTTNGDDPTTGSTAYTEPFTLSSPTTVKARAFHTPNYTDSEITSMVLSQVETPVLTVTSNRIYITCATPGATIYYTTDGSEPNPNYSSHLYNNNPLTCSGTTIKAIALKSSMLPSTLFEGSETLTCDPPVIARTDATHFTITATFPSPETTVTLYYTTGSGDPDTEYTTPVAFSGTITVKAQATATGFNPSTVVATNFNSNGLPGGGTSADPYVINDDFSFSYFLANAGNGYYQLTKDVTAPSSMGSIASFSGMLEGVADAKGNFPVISGLTQPLFNFIDGGTVKNVMLSEVNINLSSGNAGAITKELRGTSDNMGVIYNCGILSGSVGSSGSNSIVGGLVGVLGVNNSSDNCYARVINCFSYATITGGKNVGGIVGYNYYQTNASDIRTMVMNCMFYGDITGGTTVAPVYGGTNINNLQGGLNTFNYYAYDKLKTKAITAGKYNCALAVEENYLNRFEFYRLLLNSNKKLAAFYITGNVDDANLLAKWVLETADRSIADPKPYPVLKAQGYYPSIINPDMANAPDSTAVGPNKGGKLRKTLSVTISESNTTTGGQTKPSGASITTTSMTLSRTDKDFDRFNFNYDKVQLPYYNDVGTGNYTENRVVTGWKITAITTLDDDPYNVTFYDYTMTYASNQSYFDFPNYNFADRRSSNKDLYSVSGRVFSQGAYFDIPYGVTEITIEPYWAKACYIADPSYDVVYDNSYENPQDVTQTGTQVSLIDPKTTFNGQSVETSITRALDTIANNLGGLGLTVYDNAIVLVGNLHLNTVPLNGDRPFTMMSVDTDNDHEPDYSLIYHHKNRSNITPIRFDFLNIPGTAQAQKPNGASLICNFTIFKTRGWFEVTNTAFMYSSQLEYENGDLDGATKINAPLILLGGIFDQFVSTQKSTVYGKTIYIHVGSNVWINSFGLGTHSDGSKSTPHVPVSVTGGEFIGFYLTGTYNANADEKTDNAECYISGGYFHEAAGAAQEAINGNVQWQIYNAEIDNFFGGGTNDAKPIKGDVTVDIYNSHVTTYCGGPKFGNMQDKKKVTTYAEGCTFEKFFGAGYGGLSYVRKKYHDIANPKDTDWSNWQNDFINDRGKYFDGETDELTQGTGNNLVSYGFKGPGVATDFDYEFFVWSSGTTGARFFVKFASFSLAQCNDVESTLKHCTINGDFFGGGNLGKVIGTATSVLDSCTVKGNAYGAGYSASLEPIEVRDAGFALNGSGSYLFPNFNKSSGMFESGTFSGTTTFQWEHGTFPNNDNPDPNFTNNKVTTDVDLDDLGSVQQVDLTITGNSAIGTPGDPDKGHVFGGGDESAVIGNTLVKILGHIKVYGNIYGGGNQGEVQGNTKVIMNGKTN